MARQEEHRFLDLDMVAQQIPNADDRSLFQEAVNCYYAGSHRAAAILAWYAAANCLKRRILQLKAEGDGIAREVAASLSPGEGAVGEEENLIASARKCDLIDDIEEKSLRFARDMRNKCAHPTGIVPPAEAIRHVLYICSQYVLCRKSYRGIAYIEDTVTTQFDDKHFLPAETMLTPHCSEIAEQVPRRLWPQFIRIAGEQRGASHTETWRTNAYRFFERLFALADDSLATELASALQVFERSSPEFFAVLIGIEKRVTRFWDHHKRTQVRYRLREISAVKLRADEVHSWATICTVDGFELEDRDLLRDKFQALSRFLAIEAEFLASRRWELVDLIQTLIRDDATSSATAAGCRHLFGTTLFDELEASTPEEAKRWEDALADIVSETIVRFVRDTKHHELLESVREWNTTLLKELLRSAPAFWLECSEDNPEDVAILFEARRELENRNPLAVPPDFTETIRRILKGDLLQEWRQDESAAGSVFRLHLTDEEASQFGATFEPSEQPSTPDIPDDFWHARLGVRISPQQDQILRLLSQGDDVTIDLVASAVGRPEQVVRDDLEYLVIQGMIVNHDDRYSLREDLRQLAMPSVESPIVSES